LRELIDQQQKLVHLYYEGDVSKEVLKAEQERIDIERAQAQQWADAAHREVADVDHALSDALLLIDKRTAPYLTSSPFERRLINLAIYLMLLIFSLEEIDAKTTALYAQLVPMARQATRRGHQPPGSAKTNGNQAKKDRDPDFRGHGSHFKQMAERAGFEPAMEFNPHTRLAGECLQPLGHLSKRTPGASV
jgi:hypothetical protein